MSYRISFRSTNEQAENFQSLSKAPIENRRPSLSDRIIHSIQQLFLLIYTIKFGSTKDKLKETKQNVKRPMQKFMKMNFVYTK